MALAIDALAFMALPLVNLWTPTYGGDWGDWLLAWVLVGVVAVLATCIGLAAMSRVVACSHRDGTWAGPVAVVLIAANAFVLRPPFW